MESNADKHNKIKVVLIFLLLILVTTYLTVNTYEQLVDYRESDELVFTITPKNTVFIEESKTTPWYLAAYHSIAEFFSPTRTLVPVLVIFPENSEKSEISRDQNRAIAEISRDKPQEIDYFDNLNPKDIDKKPTSNNSSSSGGSGSSGIQWNVGAHDNDTSYGEKGNTAIADIFSDSKVYYNKKLIYPGISGKYYFTVDNTKNDYNIVYNVTFTEEDITVIPMEYRLKNKNGYLDQVGKWYRLDELSTLIHLKTMSKRDALPYTLEWKWSESNNDNQYIQYGGEEYTLKITVYAEAR